jgi:hypothetical protein
MALHGVATPTPTTPFFRFPGFETTPATLDHLQSRRIVVFGADLWASDWNRMPPKQELKLIAEKLKAARKGIILFHDPEGPDRRHAACVLALSQGQRLSRGPCGAGCVRQSQRPMNPKSPVNVIQLRQHSGRDGNDRFG